MFLSGSKFSRPKIDDNPAFSFEKAGSYWKNLAGVRSALLTFQVIGVPPVYPRCGFQRLRLIRRPENGLHGLIIIFVFN